MPRSLLPARQFFQPVLPEQGARPLSEKFPALRNFRSLPVLLQHLPALRFQGQFRGALRPRSLSQKESRAYLYWSPPCGYCDPLPRASTWERGPFGVHPSSAPLFVQRAGGPAPGENRRPQGLRRYMRPHLSCLSAERPFAADRAHCACLESGTWAFVFGKKSLWWPSCGLGNNLLETFFRAFWGASCLGKYSQVPLYRQGTFWCRRRDMCSLRPSRGPCKGALF